MAPLGLSEFGDRDAIGATGLFLASGNIVTTLESVRADHSTPNGAILRKVVGRIIMPVSGAQTLVTGLNAFLEKHGHSPSGAITHGATKQLGGPSLHPADRWAESEGDR